MNRGESDKIYTMHGKTKLLAIKGKIDGIPALVYMKGEKIIGYSFLDEIVAQMKTGPYKEFTTIN